MSIQVFYNGVTLQSCTIISWQSNAKYNGPDYLYTENRLTVDAIINPTETSYTGAPVQGSGGTAPYWNTVQTPGISPTVTHYFLQEVLLQPRKLLLIYNPGADALYFPDGAAPVTPANLIRRGFAIDPANGPRPISADIVEAVGATTFLCRYVIEFNTLHSPSTKPSIVLSHRWSQVDEIEPKHYLTTRTTRGRVVVRADQLARNVHVVDDLRDALFQPIASNCKRTFVEVNVSEDGTEATYTIVDEEQMMLFKQQVTDLGITSIDCTHEAEVSKPSIEDVLVPAVEQGFRFGGALGGALAGDLGGLTINIPGVLGGAGFALGAGLGVGLTVLQHLPRAYHAISCVVEGNSTALRKNMEAIALEICLQRLTATGISQTLAATWFKVNHHVTGKTVTVDVKAKAGIDQLINTTTQFLGALSNIPVPSINRQNQIQNITVTGLFRAIANNIESTVSGVVSFPTSLMPDIEYSMDHLPPNATNGSLPMPPSSTFLRYNPSTPGAPLPIPFGGQVTVGAVAGTVNASVLAGANPPPPGGFQSAALGSRGTLVQALITQALVDSYMPPPPTPDASNVVGRPAGIGSGYPPAQNIGMQ
jgi:hypothetical protein